MAHVRIITIGLVTGIGRLKEISALTFGRLCLFGLKLGLTIPFYELSDFQNVGTYTKLFHWR